MKPAKLLLISICLLFLVREGVWKISLLCSPVLIGSIRHCEVDLYPLYQVGMRKIILEKVLPFTLISLM